MHRLIQRFLAPAGTWKLNDPFVALDFTQLISPCEYSISQEILGINTTCIAQWAPQPEKYVHLLEFNNMFFYFFQDGTKESRGINTLELEPPSVATSREGRETAPHPGREQHQQSISKQMEMNVSCANCLVLFFNQ